MWKVSVITAAIGRPELQQCVESVAKQSYNQVEHIVVADGPARAKQVEKLLKPLSSRPHIVTLPFVTGHSNYFSHRIYGAMPFFTNADWVVYLDEDNWIEVDHVSRLVALAKACHLQWAYALRNIVSWQGKHICRDDCNSLGWWPSYDGGYHHVDSNCFFIKRSIAVAFSHIWHRPAYDPKLESPDRALCMQLLKEHPQVFTTGEYSVNYRIGGHRSEADDRAFYMLGNRIMSHLYRRFPWSHIRVGGRIARHPCLAWELRENNRRFAATYSHLRAKLFAPLQNGVDQGNGCV